MDKNQELKNFNLVKIILMLAIVFYHSMLMFAGADWGPDKTVQELQVIGYIAEWLNFFHVYAFTLVSGYIFYYIKYEKGGYQKYLPFLYNKAKRLLVPYVFIAAVWVMPVYSYFFGTDGLVDKFLLGKAPSQLWFLLMLFWVFAIFWWMSDLANHKPFLTFVLVCVIYCLGTFAPEYYCINKALQYILFFYLGFLMRKYDLGNRILYQIPSFVYLSTDIVIFVLCKVIGGHEEMIFKLLSFGGNALLHMVGTVGAFVILQKFVNRFLAKNRIVDFFSKHSMVIYLVHQQLIYFSIGWFNGIVPPVVLILINFCFSLMVSAVFSLLMHKTKVTRFLVGSK